MANRKYGGKEFAPTDDFKLNKSFDPWGTVGDRGSDATGPERGQQWRGGSQSWESRGADDADFLKPSQTGYPDRTDVHQRLSRLIDGQVDQPAGPLLGGGGPVSNNLENADKDKRKRPYRDGKGPQSNDGL